MRTACSLQSDLGMVPSPRSSVAFFALLVPVLAISGCAVHQFADGTVSYTSTPAVADHTGALPLRSLVCIAVRDPDQHTAGVRLGSCQLAGFNHAHPGRTRGGESELRAVGGVCELPTSEGPLSLRVTNATLHYEGDSVDINVGGTATDGRYVTYRFTGILGEDGPSADCDAVLSASTNS